MIWHEEKGPEKFIQSLEISDNDNDFELTYLVPKWRHWCAFQHTDDMMAMMMMMMILN